jgi:hypothetical protein
MVEEETANQAVVIDIPDVDSERLWTQLRGSSLLDRVIPSQQAASSYYVSELELLLSQEGRPVHLKMQDEAERHGGPLSSTHQMVAVIQPVNRPLWRIFALRAMRQFPLKPSESGF